MTKHLYFLTAALLITTSLHCMEKELTCVENIRQPLMNITCVEHIRQALYVTDTCIVVSSKTGGYFIDPTKNTVLQHLCPGKNPNIALSHDKTKLALAYKHKVNVYDCATRTKKWEAKLESRVKSVIFPPFDNAILIHFKKAHCVCIHPYDKDIPELFLFRVSPKKNTLTIAFNPVRPEMAVSPEWNYSLAEPTNFPHIQPIQFDENCYHLCEYSPNGNFLVLGSKHTDKPHIISLNTDNPHIVSLNSTNNITDYIPLKETQSINHLKFHPNSAVVATLTTSLPTQDLVLDYWNARTYERICPSLLLNDKQLNNEFLLKNFMLSFSPSGKKLLVIVPGKCFLMDVPFEVIYHTEAIEKAHFIFWLLQNLKENPSYSISNDILKLFMYNLLALYER